MKTLEQIQESALKVNFDASQQRHFEKLLSELEVISGGLGFAELKKKAEAGNKEALQVMRAYITKKEQIVEFIETKEIYLERINYEDYESLKILKEHDNEVRSLVDLGDGRMASGSREGTIKIWDIKTGKCLRTIDAQEDENRPYEKAVWSIDLLKDGRLASAQDDGTVKIWDVDTGECLKVLEVGSGARADCVIELKDGSIACACDDTMKIWNSEAENYEVTFDEKVDNWVFSICELSDGRIATAGFGGEIKIWNRETGECEMVFEGHEGNAKQVIELHDGRLASVGKDNAVRILNRETGECEKIMKSEKHQTRSVLELKDGRIASGNEGGIVEIWDPETGECDKTFKWQTNTFGECVDAIIELENNNLVFGVGDGSITIFGEKE